MCEAGRIRHHLKNHLWDASTTVLLAGYQAQGTLGRILQEGAKHVTIMGDDIAVKATIDQVEDYSGHADGPELVAWMKGRLPVAKSVFLTHGEEESQLGLARDLLGIGIAEDCIIRPQLDDVYDLTGPACARLESRPRIDPNAVASRDSNNDLADLLLHIKDQVGKAGDEPAKTALIRRVRRSLTGDGSPPVDRRRPPVSGPSRRSRGFDEG
jgi:metallo-beta-lactamase family protein